MSSSRLIQYFILSSAPSDLFGDEGACLKPYCPLYSDRDAYVVRSALYQLLDNIQ